VQRAVTVLGQIALGSRPADHWLEALFRAHKEMGQRDRASVSALVYGVLRDVLRLQLLAGAEPAAWLARHLADLGLSAEQICACDLPPPVADAAVPVAFAHRLPEAYWQRLLPQLGAQETPQLAAALAQEASVDLRANTLRSSRADCLAVLHAEGRVALPTPYSPVGIRLAKRLSHHAAVFADGLAEPQDEGSQLLAQMLAARPGELVIDYCAGAGGKSLALAAAMQNQGRILACDVLQSRLAKLLPRAAKAGAECISTRLLSPGALEDVAGSADAVLVDAPCSGSGTLRRSPELRLKPLELASLTPLQAQILADAARLLRPGGRLVYATCSLFVEENEAIVAGFLASHPQFERHAAAPIPLLATDASLRLWPHRHGTDGFFAAGLRRKCAA
jgi:16S rRNA (cytosine967-C5)-methyltransferase